MSDSRPHIVFLHCDQWNADAFSAIVGPRHLSTPHSDRIFAGGIRFDRAQATYPVCCPNRSSWYSGLMPSEHGVIFNGEQYPMIETLPDLGRWLGARGYDCWYGGKWHITGRKPGQSFQELCGSHPMGEVQDDGVAMAAEAFLRERDSGKPLFLNLGLLNPHDCCYLDFTRRDLATKLGIGPSLGDALPPAPPDYDPSRPLASDCAEGWGTPEVELYRYYYYRMCEMADLAVGRIHRAVRRHLDPDKTVFIYSSDHGEFMGHRNRFKKNLCYAPSLRVPLSISAPGLSAAGAVDRDHVCGAVDVTATILDYAGAEPMPGMTFAKSLRPFVEGKPDAPWHGYVPAETMGGGWTQCFADHGFKSIFNYRQKTEELYDVDADPLERNNLAADPAHAGTFARHKAYRDDFNRKIRPSPAFEKEWASLPGA
jgi:arylsulfatase A-like enzyme